MKVKPSIINYNDTIIQPLFFSNLPVSEGRVLLAATQQKVSSCINNRLTHTLFMFAGLKLAGYEQAGL